jgi:hypothetical protein
LASDTARIIYREILLIYYKERAECNFPTSDAVKPADLEPVVAGLKNVNPAPDFAPNRSQMGC